MNPRKIEEFGAWYVATRERLTFDFRRPPLDTEILEWSRRRGLGYAPATFWRRLVAWRAYEQKPAAVQLPQESEDTLASA